MFYILDAPKIVYFSCCCDRCQLSEEQFHCVYVLTLYSFAHLVSIPLEFTIAVGAMNILLYSLMPVFWFDIQADTIQVDSCPWSFTTVGVSLTRS